MFNDGAAAAPLENFAMSRRQYGGAPPRRAIPRIVRRELFANILYPSWRTGVFWRVSVSNRISGKKDTWESDSVLKHIVDVCVVGIWRPIDWANFLLLLGMVTMRWVKRLHCLIVHQYIKFWDGFGKMFSFTFYFYSDPAVVRFYCPLYEMVARRIVRNEGNKRQFLSQTSGIKIHGPCPVVYLPHCIIYSKSRANKLHERQNMRYDSSS